MSDTAPDTDITTTGTERISKQTKRWRDVLPIHPAAELFPLMNDAELRELADDIEANGLLEQVIIYNDQELGCCLLDGRNQLDALELLGWEAGGFACESLSENQFVPCLVYEHREGFVERPEFDPYDYVISKNIRRRHLTPDQRRELIAKVLKAKPEASNRQIAKQTKADDKTVAKVRTALEATAEIPQLERTTGADGKDRPTHRHTPKPVPSPPIERNPTSRPSPSKPPTPDEVRSESDDEDNGVADPAEVEDNALHSLGRNSAHAKMFKKIFKLSSFDRGAKERISTAIDEMISKWRSAQATLNQK